MLFATILRGRTTAPVNLDTLEMGENADSMVTFYFKENSILISFVFKNKSAVALSSVSFNFHWNYDVQGSSGEKDVSK